MMMRQTKAAITTWGVAGILVAGLLMFGCSRQTGYKEQAEHGLMANKPTMVATGTTISTVPFTVTTVMAICTASW